MQRELHEENELYKLEFDPEIEAVLFTWKEFAGGQDFKDGANAIYEYFKEVDSYKVLVDTSAIKAHAEEDGAWLLDDWTPRMIEAGMDYNCVVYPESVIAEMDRDALEEELSQLDYNTLWTADMSEARGYLAEA